MQVENINNLNDLRYSTKHLKSVEPKLRRSLDE